LPSCLREFDDYQFTIVNRDYEQSGLSNSSLDGRWQTFEVCEPKGCGRELGMKKHWPGLILIFSLNLAAQGPPEGQIMDSLAAKAQIIGSPDTLRTRVSGLVRMGFQQLELDDPRLARRTFRKALSLDDGDARIYLGLGRSYLHHRSRKVKIFEMIERLFNKDFLSRAVYNLKRAAELEPDNWEVYYWLGTAYMKKYGRDDLERALGHLERAYELAGDTLQVRLKLALLHKALGDFRHAEQILFDINSSSGGQVDPQACLELVKMYAKRKEFGRAVRFYWRGVEAISTREEFKAYFDDLVIIASRQEREAFQSMPADSASAYFRGFWLRRDHRMGMEPGMRLSHHYYRLSVADSLYRVPFAARNPYLSTQVAYFPEESVPYDDRGIVYILHGPPNKTVSHLDSEVEPNVTWVYYRAPEDMILHFVALGGNREYQLVHSLDAAVKGKREFVSDSDGNILPRNSQEAIQAEKIRELYGSRLEVGRGLYFRLANHPGDIFTRMEEYSRNYLSIYEALNSESARPGYRKNLPSYYDLVDFRGSGDGKSLLEFYAGVPGKEITYTKNSQRFYYDISYQLRVYDSLWRRVEQFDNVESFESLIDPHDLVDRQVVGLGKIQLEPGNYHYFVKIQNGQSVSLYNGEISVDSYSGDSLQTSGIIAASNIFTAVADSGKFNRYSLQVQPNPSRIFHPSEKMFAYQEIYNLKPGDDGTVNYRVTYTLTRLKKDRNVLGRFYDSFKWLFGRSDDQERVVLSVEKNKTPLAEDLVSEDLAVDISDNPDGLYELTILVEDLNSQGETFRRNTRFSVRR